MITRKNVGEMLAVLGFSKNGECEFVKTYGSLDKAIVVDCKKGTIAWPDGLVKRNDTTKALPEYIFECLSADAFFKYVMEGKSGVKMPRGDKDQILRYPIVVPALGEQAKIVAKVKKLAAEVAAAEQQIAASASAKSAILGRFLK